MSIIDGPGIGERMQEIRRREGRDPEPMIDTFDSIGPLIEREMEIINRKLLGNVKGSPGVMDWFIGGGGGGG
jgi:hypothetical protein